MKLVPSFLLVLFLIPDVDCLRGDYASSFATPHRRHGQIFKSNHYNQTVLSNNGIMQLEIDLEETNISDEELFLDLRENHWIKIFPDGGRNSGGPQFFKYI